MVKEELKKIKGNLQQRKKQYEKVDKTLFKKMSKS